MDLILERLYGNQLPSVTNIEEHVNYITKELGLNIKTFEKLPQLFGYSIENNLKPKVEYITKELGLNVKTFEKNYSLFGYSLKKRIIPRVEFLKTKNKSHQLLSHITQGDAYFSEKVAKCPLKEYEDWKEEYLKVA